MFVTIVWTTLWHNVVKLWYTQRTKNVKINTTKSYRWIDYCTLFVWQKSTLRSVSYSAFHPLKIEHTCFTLVVGREVSKVHIEYWNEKPNNQCAILWWLRWDRHCILWFLWASTLTSFCCLSLVSHYIFSHKIPQLISWWKYEKLVHLIPLKAQDLPWVATICIKHHNLFFER
jgi:hypothetical protein